MSDYHSYRFRSTVSYDGTDFYGFQRQKEGVRTVQGVLELALKAISGRQIGVMGAGRTDSGVHATGQVVAFDLTWRHGVTALRKALNANLPKDVSVRDLQVVDPRFHPRFSACRRRYEYLVELCEDGVRRPLTRERHWQIYSRLDLVSMNKAASYLVGRQDFATFGQPPQGDNTVREVFSASWNEKGSLLLFSIEANAFLYRMVRSIVGTLTEVGTHKRSVDSFNQSLQACNRRQCGVIAPAHGLTLVSVEYDSKTIVTNR